MATNLLAIIIGIFVLGGIAYAERFIPQGITRPAKPAERQGYDWVQIQRNDVDLIKKYAEIMNEAVRECNIHSVEDVLSFMDRKLCWLYYLKDKQHEVVVGFKYSNGRKQWKLAHLGFRGPVNKQLYKKCIVIIEDFVDQQGDDKVYSIIPKNLRKNYMNGFFAGITDRKYWRLSNKDIEKNTAKTAVVVLRKETSVLKELNK